MSADRGRIAQVIANLLGNAIKYSPDGAGGGGGKNALGKVRVSVRDQGMGIPEAARSRIFTKFFRGEAGVGGIGGMGLGLAVPVEIGGARRPHGLRHHGRPRVRLLFECARGSRSEHFLKSLRGGAARRAGRLSLSA